MALSDDCLCGRSQHLTFASNDKIVVDGKTFARVLSLINLSIDDLTNARHREIFLECLNTYLVESPAESERDDAYIFRASLLLDSYYEYVPACLALIHSNLEEACTLMREVKYG
ncbi:hypothetical protein Osc7112_6924 (plasmid) [Oscillatoria nigro-viridis PCC 7112]|uniref:Uncharacterized protein n=1 Tax=Phormidium nigroviride PCC 7112 TaxID=179408 RepID=K9VSU0_9CYAN|nr:hypothetical protein [Oscillatoria nigro-viridis]AFZ11001.1 hypothetical protein Osc7112_6924 [Oscillatoria nigro-viridis PCC 7112]